MQKEIRIPKTSSGTGTALLCAGGLFLASLYLLFSGRDILLAWLGILLFGSSTLLVIRNVLFPEIAVRIDSAGVHDAFGLIVWSHIQQPRLCLTPGKERFSFVVPCELYPGRGHPHDQDWPDLFPWSIDLRQARKQLEALRSLVTEQLGADPLDPPAVG